MHKPAPLVLLALASALVLVLQVVESRWPQMGWLLFFVLTLSLGFAHGVLDVVLLAHALPKPRGAAHAARHVALYSAAVLLVLAAAWVWPAGALAALLLISVWHFGQELQPKVLARVALGGAAVMWPLIVQPQAIRLLLAQAFPQAAWLFLAWQVLAWGWLLVLMVALIAHWPERSVRDRLLMESAALALLYALLSPWLAFALYFSLFHSAMHIRRVWCASQVAGVQWNRQRTGLLLTALLTFALIAASAWLFMPHIQLAQWLHSGWALPAWVALVTAVTVPHGILVARVWHWLTSKATTQ